MLTKQQLATSTTKTTPYPHVQSRINTVIEVKISSPYEKTGLTEMTLLIFITAVGYLCIHIPQKLLQVVCFCDNRTNCMYSRLYM